MEFKITKYTLPEAIQFNFEELKTELVEKTEAYKHMVYTDKDIKAAKADRADLNRLKKALNDERINRQKEYMKPFDSFKKQVDEIISIIDEPVKIIDEQVKAFEKQAKEKKEKEVRELFASLNTYDWLTFEQVFDQKWLNASTSMSTIEGDINVILAGIETNMGSLKGLEYEFEATEEFKRTLSLSDALAENRKLIDLAKKRAEMEAVLEQAKAGEIPVIEVDSVKVENPTDAPFINVEKVEELKPSVPGEWMTLKVKINEYEFDALTEWLNGQGIEWSIV
jgi:hypothetical protein